MVLGGGVVALASGANISWLLVVSLVIASATLLSLSRRSNGENTGSHWRDNEASTKEDALDVLKQQYATGEIDDEEFERRVETLLKNETVADAETRLDVDHDATTEARSGKRNSNQQNAPRRHKPHHHGKHRHRRH